MISTPSLYIIVCISWLFKTNFGRLRPARGATGSAAKRASRPSVPAGLLHSRAGLRQFFEPALDLGAGHREILELAVVEPVQGYARGVTLVARDDACEEAVGETAQARQQNCSSPGKGSGGGGRDSGQHRHGYILSRAAGIRRACRHPFYRRPAASMVSAGCGASDEHGTRLR